MSGQLVSLQCHGQYMHTKLSCIILYTCVYLRTCSARYGGPEGPFQSVIVEFVSKIDISTSAVSKLDIYKVNTLQARTIMPGSWFHPCMLSCHSHNPSWVPNLHLPIWNDLMPQTWLWKCECPSLEMHMDAIESSHSPLQMHGSRFISKEIKFNKGLAMITRLAIHINQP